MDLTRFVEAQSRSYETALAEIKRGRKERHWMWFIFPQIRGLGSSPTAMFYAIQNRAEAIAYLAHPVLGPRLRQITQALLEQPETDVRRIFSYPDDLKLRSSMTLFGLVSGEPLFQAVLDKFYGGAPDQETLRILQNP